MRRLYIPGITLLAFGYPLTMVWFLEFGIASPILNIWVKMFSALLVVMSLMNSLTSGRKIPRNLAPFYIFMFLYGIRLLYDVLVLNIVAPFSSGSYVLVYFFALTLMPALTIGISFDEEDIPMIHRWFFWTLAVVNASLLLYASSVGYIGNDDVLLGRFEVVGEQEQTALINPIIVSLMGAALSLFVLGRLAVFSKMAPGTQLWHLGLFGLGIFNMLLGGSRGPVVGFVLGVLVVTATIVYGVRSKRLQFHIRPRLFMYLAGLLVGLVFLASQDTHSIGVFERFRHMFEPGGRAAEARTYVYAAAWEDFRNSPLIGHSYLTLNGQAMPHNVLLEALASLGILGGAGAAVWLWRTAQGVWNAALVRYGPHGYSLALVAAAFVILTMTSGSIGQSPELWIICIVAMCMSGRPSGGQQNHSVAA